MSVGIEYSLWIFPFFFFLFFSFFFFFLFGSCFLLSLLVGAWGLQDDECLVPRNRHLGGRLRIIRYSSSVPRGPLGGLASRRMPGRRAGIRSGLGMVRTR